MEGRSLVMKRVRFTIANLKMVAVIQLILLSFLLIACGQDEVDESTMTKSYFQPAGIEVATEDGFYHLNRTGFL